MTVHFKRKDGSTVTLDLIGSGLEWQVADRSETRQVQVLERTAERLVFDVDGTVHRAYVRVAPREIRVVIEGRESVFARQEATSAALAAHGTELHEPVLRAPVPGRVVRVLAEPGAKVQAGDVLVVIEAMKMETPVVAPADGTVSEIHVASGDLVDVDQALATCEY